MKKTTFFLFSICVSAYAMGALESQNKMTSGDVVWSVTSNWQNADVDLPPNTNASYISNEWNSKSIIVDGDYTVGKIGSNSDTGYSNNGEFYYKMIGTGNDGADGSMSIDVAQITNAAIDVGLNGRSNSKIYNQNVIFEGGTINVFDSLNSARSVDIFVNCYTPDDFTENHLKALTFTSENTLNVGHNIRFGSTNGGLVTRTMQMNLLGTTNVFSVNEDSSIAYKTVAFVGGNGNSQYTNIEFNIGTKGEENTKFTSGSVTQFAATDVNVKGDMNVYGNYSISSATGKPSNFNIESGANVLMTSANSADEIKFSATHANVNIAGNFTIEHSGSKAMADILATNSTLTVKEGGNFIVTSQTNSDTSFSMTNGSTVIIEKGGYMSVKSQLRIYGDNTRIVIKQENGLRSGEYNSKWKLIMGDNYTNVNIDLYANQDLYGISFWSTATADANAKINFFISDDVTSITFDKLIADGGALNEYRFIEISNFRNDIFFFKTKGTDLDLLTQFSADGYKDFYWEETTGGWYLNAIQVTEPATIASIFGALALALAIYRRRK